jgi:hypothetical protein
MEENLNIKKGQTRCEVWKTTINPQTGSEKREIINEGIIIDYACRKGYPAYVRVWNDKLRKGSGGYQSLQEYYAISSKLINVKFTGEEKFPIDILKIKV